MINYVCGWCDKDFESDKEQQQYYEIGVLCDECEDSRDDKTGYCSITCQLCGECDGSC